MAKRKKHKRRGELWVGIGALAAVLVILLAVAVSLPSPPEILETEPPETTLPEPTQPTVEPNPYGPFDFQYEGKYLTCIAGKSVLGIDVSSHQGEIDWTQVAGAGIEFVMIRAGNRGYKYAQINEDEYARRNYEGAKEAGLKVGVYFFSQAISVEEAIEEANFLLNMIRDWELDMPVVYDWEFVSAEARTGQMDARSVTDCTLAFCQVIEAAGYQSMIYFNSHQATEHLILTEVDDYPFWLAMYTDRMTYRNKVEMWQYTDQGQVPGISGNVDMNLWFPE